MFIFILLIVIRAFNTELPCFGVSQCGMTDLCNVLYKTETLHSLNTGSQGWICGSVVREGNGSSVGLEMGSQHQYQMAHNCMQLQLLGI